jgi:hypothetical protein
MTKATLAVCIAAAFLPSLGRTQFGQFGMVNLPPDDFTWRWGREFEEGQQRLPEDFSVRGGEAEFQCNLTGRLSASNRMTDPEINEMETALGASLFFIQAAAELMNELDLQHQLDWAELACVKPDGREEDPAELQEKVERARQKAVEDMLKRRERREEQQ